MTDAMFRGAARWCAYAIAGLSFLYAAVYLGLVRPDPSNSSASALANGFIAVSGILATFAVVAVGDQVGGAIGRWLRFVGVGWALLSAAHGTFSMDIRSRRPVVDRPRTGRACSLSPRRRALERSCW